MNGGGAHTNVLADFPDHPPREVALGFGGTKHGLMHEPVEFRRSERGGIMHMHSAVGNRHGAVNKRRLGMLGIGHEECVRVTTRLPAVCRLQHAACRWRPAVCRLQSAV